MTPAEQGIPYLFPESGLLARDQSSINVHTRCLRKGGGVWEGWAVWEGDEPTAKKTFYQIRLS